MRLNTYLAFNGNCQEAFQFYARVLGGKIVAMVPHRGSPTEAHTPPELLDQILHARLTVGESVLMGSDAPPGRGGAAKGYSVNLGVDTPSEAERIFHGLAEGGTVMMPIEETFWAFRFGMLTDRFGIPWMVNCERPVPAQE